jgi:predicted PurR-regulated permease PerM
MRSEMTPWTIRGMGLAAGALFVYGLIQIGIAAGGVFLLFFAAVLLASALEPIVGWLRDHLPLGRGATILVVYASFFATVLGLALVVVPAAIHQADTIIKGLPPFFEETRRWAGTLRPAALATSVRAFIASVADIFNPAPPPVPTQVV